MLRITRNITYEGKPGAGVKNSVLEVKPGVARAVSCGQVYVKDGKIWIRCHNKFAEGSTNFLKRVAVGSDGAEAPGNLPLVMGSRTEIEPTDILVTTITKMSSKPEDNYGLVTTTTTFELV